MKKGFTLIELVIVILIIGVIASMGFSYFVKSRETALARDAGAHLRLIAAAQKIYRLETGSYWPTGNGTSSNLSAINTDLRVILNNNNFNYTVNATGSTAFRVTADRDGTGGFTGCADCRDCIYAVNQTEQVAAVDSTKCPVATP